MHGKKFLLLPFFFKTVWKLPSIHERQENKMTSVNIEKNGVSCIFKWGENPRESSEYLWEIII